MSRYEVTVSREAGFRNVVRARTHESYADEPVELEGTDAGPTPWELMLSAMASCTTITLQMYANRKGWTLDGLDVAARLDDDNTVSMTVEIRGDLDDDQRARLEQIAQRCPVVATVQKGTTVHKDIVIHSPAAG